MKYYRVIVNNMRVLFLCLLLCGCVKYVDIPVWVCPEPNIPKRETLKSSGITDSSSTDDILRALMYDTVYLDTYSKQLITILEGYQVHSTK